ncbi:hypothetical protein [Thalassospira australica]|uniref:hypothetical protein n=1 Tax=Thalassospira australica TaxID=1528106 RepID=UPI00384FD88D
MSTEQSLTGIGDNCVIMRDFTRYDHGYQDKALKYIDYLGSLSLALRKFSEYSRTMLASQQLYIYAKWLARYTAYWPELDRLVDRLENSFEDADQSYVARQSSVDGSWGWQYNEFHHKFDATIVRLHELANEGRAPRYPLRFLEPIATAPAMRDYLEKLLVSDIAATGRNQRDEFGSVICCLAQLCFKPLLRRYAQEHVRGIELDQSYVDAFCDFLDEIQNPETGYWGPWYVSDGKTHRYDDLSYTFHIVSYRKGRVGHWSDIIRTTLESRTLEYPQGWLSRGTFNNHNNYDVAKIFRYGWPHMRPGERVLARDQIASMLDWCIGQSLKRDGSFVSDSQFYNSLESCYYFGVSFLDEVGYFQPSKRFWTQQKFPYAPILQSRIRRKLDEFDAENPSVIAAKWKIGPDATSAAEMPMQSLTRDSYSRMPLLSGDDCAATEEREFEFILRPNNDG